MSERGDRSDDGPENEQRHGGSDGFTYRIGDDETPSEAVVAAAAARRFPDVNDAVDRLESAVAFDPLYRTVDPDALDALFRSAADGTARRRGRVTFEFGGYELTVIDGTRVEGRPLDSDRESREEG